MKKVNRMMAIRDQLYMLDECQMRKSELYHRIAEKTKFLKHLKLMLKRSTTDIIEAKEELKKRPRKRYSPGFYYSHDDHDEGSFVIVDHQGHPWMLTSDGWWKFGKSMNNSWERVWQKIGDL